MSGDAQVSRYYEDALARYEKDDLAGAIIQLKNALKIDNKNIAVQVLLGKALVAHGEPVAAEVALTEALRLGVNRAEVVLPLARSVVEQGRQQEVVSAPQFAPAGLPEVTRAPMLLVRAGAFADLGDTKSALMAIQDARAIDASSPASWIAEVPIRIRANQFQEAKVAADNAVQRAPRSGEPLYVRGNVSHAEGDLKTALAWYDKAIQVEPHHIDALLARAGVYMDLQRVQEAKRDVTTLLSLSKVEPRGDYLRALIATREHDDATARAAYTSVVTLLDPVPIAFLRYRPQLLMLGGLSYYALNQLEKALPYLEAVQRAQPGSPVGKLVAQIHLRNGNPDRAIVSLDAYLRAFPRDTQAILLLAATHMAQGRYGRAVQLTQDALKIGESADVRAALGVGLVGTGKIESAASELQAAVKANPGHVAAGTALASIYLMDSRPDAAIKILEPLFKLNPKNAGVINLLGMARQARGDAAGARRAFDEALAIDPQFAAPKINIAKQLIASDKLDDAAILLTQVMRSRDRTSEAAAELARIAELRGQLSEAQNLLEKADDLAGPSDYSSGLALVEFHLRNGQAEAAREASKRLTAKAPEAVQVQLMLARVSLANGDAAAARSTLSRAASLASYDSAVLLKIALQQLQANHLPGAAYTLNKLLAERPDFPQAQALMAEVEIRQGELAKAETRAQQLAARYPKLGVGYGLLGDASAARGNLAAALTHYRRSHALEPSAASLLRVFNTLVAQKDAAAAVATGEQWLRSHPQDVVVRRAVADALARLGQYAAARKHYESLVAASPKDANAWNNLANVLLLLKDASASAAAEKALALAPNAPHIIGTAGWAAFKAGQPDRALQLLRDARLRDPGNADTRYFLGAVLASKGRKGEALDELKAAVASGRGFVMAKEAEALMATLR